MAEIRFDDRFVLLGFIPAPGAEPETAALVPEAILGVFPHPDGGSSIVLPGGTFGPFEASPDEVRSAVAGVMRAMMEKRMQQAAGPQILPLHGPFPKFKA